MPPNRARIAQQCERLLSDAMQKNKGSEHDRRNAAIAHLFVIAQAFNKKLRDATHDRRKEILREIKGGSWPRGLGDSWLKGPCAAFTRAVYEGWKDNPADGEMLEGPLLGSSCQGAECIFDKFKGSKCGATTLALSPAQAFMGSMFGPERSSSENRQLAQMSTGSGKTFAILALASKFASEGVACYIVAPRSALREIKASLLPETPVDFLKQILRPSKLSASQQIRENVKTLKTAGIHFINYIQFANSVLGKSSSGRGYLVREDLRQPDSSVAVICDEAHVLVDSNSDDVIHRARDKIITEPERFSGLFFFTWTPILNSAAQMTSLLCALCGIDVMKSLGLSASDGKPSIPLSGNKLFLPVKDGAYKERQIARRERNAWFAVGG